MKDKIDEGYVIKRQASGSKNELREALASSKLAFWGVGIFSATVNILMLTGSLFMLQVYDRVLSSRSSATLFVLFAVVVFLYLVMGLLDHYRNRLLAVIGARFQVILDNRIYTAVLKQAEYPVLRERPAGALRDLASIQTALSSPGTGAFFDLPWVPLFAAVLFLFHSWMGWFAIASGLLVLVLALFNQMLTKEPQAEAARFAADADAKTEATRKAIETVRGLGMLKVHETAWSAARNEALVAGMRASDLGGAFSSGTKAIRLLLQSAILALGALLALQGQISPGAMIAGSILLGRALSPIEQSIGYWPQFQRALSAWRDLAQLLRTLPAEQTITELPRPQARLDVRDLLVVPPGETNPVLQGVTFSAKSGDAIAVIGPSASGKSSLARVLTGFWRPSRGEVRLDGAELSQYEVDRLGHYLGYLPQDVILFSGTIAQNVSRFDPDAKDTDIIDAAKQAAAHELILGLPQGYNTVVTENGGRLSGGQRQRIGLARAFYSNPVVLVLDEPNANLDDPGVQALNKSISNARATGKIALVMSHRPSALAECNLVMIIENGQMRAFGPRDEILERFVRPVKNIVGGTSRENS